MRNFLLSLLPFFLFACGELGLSEVQSGEYTCSYYPAEISKSESSRLVAYLHRSGFPGKVVRLGKTDGIYEIAFEGNPDNIESAKRDRILSAMAKEIADSCFTKAKVMVITSDCLDCTKYKHYRGYSWRGTAPHEH